MFKRFQHVNVAITDNKFLKSIALHGTICYLEENQWEHDNDYRGIETSRYTKQDKAVLVPKKEGNPDYANLIGELIARISQVDEKNQLVIAEEIFEYQENWQHTLNLINVINRPRDEEDDEEDDAAYEKQLQKLKKEYVKELKQAVEEAKEYNERRFNHSGMPKSPLYEYGRVIAVFREYWVACDKLNQELEFYYNPKWLTHEDLEGELKQIIDDMPFYPIGTSKDGGYC